MAEERGPAVKKLDDGAGRGGGCRGQKAESGAKVDSGNDIAVGAVSLQGANDI